MNLLPERSYSIYIYIAQKKTASTVCAAGPKRNTQTRRVSVSGQSVYVYVKDEPNFGVTAKFSTCGGVPRDKLRSSNTGMSPSV